jgi:hypothetical protein
MSLHALANHMQSKGRNDDTMLVHMTPKEVGGLQALAMAHGGSLTINPETGLPEAGFLKSLLPMIAGFALNAFLPGVGTAIGSALGGLSGAAGTGILVGGATGLATGSLEKGLKAGLGAYGGAGLGTGVTQTGAQLGSVPQATAGNPAITQISAPVQEGASSALMKQIEASRSMIPPNSAVAQSMGLPGSLAQAPTAITPSTTDLLGTGLKNSFGNGMEGLKSLYGNIPGGTLPALGAYALMGGMGDDKNNIPPVTNQGMIRPYTLDRQQNPDAYNTQIGSNPQRMPVDARGNLMDTSERSFFTDKYTAGKPYKAPGPEYAADGGLMGLAVGGMPEQQAAFQAVGMNGNYPMAQIQSPMYSDPSVQRPMAREVVNPSGDAGVDQFTGEARMAGGGMTAFGGGGVANPQASAPTVDYDYNPKNMEYTQTTTTPPPASIGGKDSPLRRAMGQSSGANGFVNPGLFQGLIPALMQQQRQPTVETKIIGGMTDPYMPPQQQTQIGETTPSSDIAQYAVGGIADLGGYSDGGRLLRGPGDGVSDSIPASIGNRQPARLADGEFVVPARIVSEIGNGSTEAGARKLYAMMDRVQHARRKTVGKNQVAKNTKAEKLLPA